MDKLVNLNVNYDISESVPITAKNLLNNSVSIEIIAKSTGLSIEEINKI